MTQFEVHGPIVVPRVGNVKPWISLSDESGVRRTL
jgi:hypothetical protein